MKKAFKKFLSLLLICCMIFTTNSFATFADVLNNVETTTIEETTIEYGENFESDEITTEYVDEPEEEETSEDEKTIEVEEISEKEESIEVEEISEIEETIATEESIEKEETVEIEETIATEETPVEDETSKEGIEESLISTEESERDNSIEETTPTEVDTSTIETNPTDETVKEEILGDGENYKFTFKMQDGFGWYNSEDGDTTIEYDSSDNIVIPVVYPVGGHSAGYVWIDYGWAKDVGGHSGPTMTENQLQELINNWKTNPTEDITIYPNFQQFYQGDIKTLPSKLNYTVGQDIDLTGIVFELTKDDKKKEVPYALPQYERLYSTEILDAEKNPITSDAVTADTKYCRFHFDDMIYQDVELTVNVPHTFTFFTNELYPEDFGWFDEDHTINKKEYKSEELDTKPIEIPLVYILPDSGTGVWLDVGWLLYKGAHEPEEWLSDKQLETLVNNWTKNPNEDVKVRVSFNTIYHTIVKKEPNRTTYHIGEKIDSTGLVIEASDEIFDPPTWTKDVAYDAVQYKNLFATEILDADRNPITSETVTAETKYCRFRFASYNLNVEVELKVLKAVSEISLVKDQDWKEYSTGEKFDPKGLVIHVKYDDGEEADVAYDDKRVLFMFDPFTLESSTTEVTVYYGGKTTSTRVSMVDNVYVVYFYNKDTKGVHSVYSYTGDENNVVSALDAAMSQGAKGFYKITASGYHEAYLNYDKDTEMTLTKDEALDVYFNEYNGNNNVYIGAAFKEPAPPAPTPTPSPGGSSSSGDSQIRGPIVSNVPTVNKIPQSELIVNNDLAYKLLIAAENSNRQKTKVVDQYGNEGFGLWLRVPNTTEWFFLTGDSNDQNTGTNGFVHSGWFSLEWDNQVGKYCFDERGIMRTGWYVENGVTYYLDDNVYSNWFGMAVTGTKVIDGITYNFDSNGALIS